MRTDRFPIIFGVAVSTLLASTMVIAGLKAGITPGVSPLVILCAWGAFAAHATSPGGKRFLNLAQVAGSSGMAVVAGVIFTAPLLQILYKQKIADGATDLTVPGVDVATLILLSLAGALVGYGFVGLTTKKFLTDPTLPAPEARACEAMVNAAVSDQGKRPQLGRSLYLGLLVSFLAPLLVRFGIAKEHVVLYAKTNGDRNFQADLPFTPIYIGIGGLLTIGTAVLVFAGSFLRLFGDFMLAGIDTTDAAAMAEYPANSMRWVGGGAMTVAVAYSLIKFMGLKREATTEDIGDASLLALDPWMKRRLKAAVGLGIAIILGWLFVKSGVNAFSLSMGATILVLASLMVPLGAILSLQIGSSASPVSGTIFVSTLVLCLVALAVGHNTLDDVVLLTPLLVGACVAVCTANDSSQDYKTMQYCGVRVQDGFNAQILGLIFGCVAVPLSLYVAHNAYGLGSPALPAPQGVMFATLVDGLLLQEQLPWTPIFIGLAVGIAAVTMDVLAGRKGMQLPAMALAVGIYLPPYLGIGILIGAMFRWFAERGGAQRNESILAAAGLITGAAALDLILGILIIANVNVDRGLKFFGVLGEGQTAADVPWIPVGDGLTSTIGVLGIIVLGGLLFINSKRKAE